MLFERLKREVRVEHRVRVVQPHDESDRGEALLQPIHKTTAEFAWRQRIAQRVDHRTRGEAASGQLPEFLQPERVDLRQTSTIETVVLDEGLCQIAPNAVTEDRDLGSNVDAWLKRGPRFAVPIQAKVAGPDAVTRGPSCSTSDAEMPVIKSTPPASATPASHFTNALSEMT